MKRPARLLLFYCSILAAQGTKPKPSAADYPAHADLNGVAIGAEYMLHSFSRGDEMYIAKDYLVVEVAVFGSKDVTLNLDAGQFALRVNGSKHPVAPQSPELVAYSLKYPDRDSGTRAEAGVGPIIIGAPPPEERFPGDRTSRPAPLPVPRAPDDSDTGLKKPPPAKPEELVIETALPVGEHHVPVSGFLYFYHRGSSKGVHALELEFTSDFGSTTIPLLKP